MRRILKPTSLYRPAMRVRGHLWTVLPHLIDRVNPPTVSGRPWQTFVSDDLYGKVTLTGLVDEVPNSKGLVVIVHGMGSNAEVSYVVRTAQAAHARGLSTLRVNLRGAQESGEDIYHAGLVGDLQAVIESPLVRSFEDVYVVGFSLGGHVTLRYGLNPDPQVQKIAAVCAPISLNDACHHIDAWPQKVYKRHLLSGLRASGKAVETRRGATLTTTSLDAIRTVREWDTKVVAARFGFRDASDYYQQVSVGPHLSELAVSSLLVFAKQDPMVAARDIHPSLAKVSRLAEVRWHNGGHVFFSDTAKVTDDLLAWIVGS